MKLGDGSVYFLKTFGSLHVGGGVFQLDDFEIHLAQFGHNSLLYVLPVRRDEHVVSRRKNVSRVAPRLKTDGKLVRICLKVYIRIFKNQSVDLRSQTITKP